MGNLNGPWIIGWVGDTSGCDEYDTIDLESKIEIIFLKFSLNSSNFL